MGFKVFEIGWCDGRRFPDPGSKSWNWRQAASEMTMSNQFFHDGGRYHIETSPLIYSANEWSGLYMIGASIMKELISRPRWIYLKSATPSKTFFDDFDFVFEPMQLTAKISQNSHENTNAGVSFLIKLFDRGLQP